MAEHIEHFQILNIKVNGIPEEHMIDVFIGNLKNNIQHEVRLWEPDSLEKAFKVARKVESKIMATKKSTTHNYKDVSVAAPSLPQPTRLIPQQLEEKRAKGLCYSCDSKYTKVISVTRRIILHRLWRGGRKGTRNIKRRGYTQGTNPKLRRNESDNIL